MASWMFGTFLANMKLAYESRVDTVFEGPKLKQVWVDIEHKCWETYLEEANDDFKGVHPYLKLKKEVSHCKAVIKEDTRREVLQDCTQRIVDLAKECSASRRVPQHASATRLVLLLFIPGDDLPVSISIHTSGLHGRVAHEVSLHRFGSTKLRVHRSFLRNCFFGANVHKRSKCS
ncbi:unnamed protein product [Symbiodinium sp. CCMP2456]|nr:unnamed protein product [Symbiodinium sp. CCMP2456]